MRERSKAQAGRPPSGPGSIRRALATAVGALLGTHSSTARASEVDSAILFYTEFDRVSAFEAVGTVHKEIGERKHLDLKVVVDILTGASPNGAQAADRVQTFTHPSGPRNCASRVETHAGGPGVGLLRFGEPRRSSESTDR